MLPLKDNIPTRHIPVITVLIIAANIAIFVYQLSLGDKAGERFIFALGAIPYEFTHPQDAPVSHGFPYPLTLFSSMFMHGGLFHIFGNMLYLWIFGNNVEDNLGHFRFIIFYLLCGVIAALSHIYLNPNSTIPMVGASGAVSGVLGAYLLLYPQAKILTLVPLGLFTRLVEIPAVVVLGFWIVVQLINGALSSSTEPGVAWFAHVGGFFAGMVLLNIFLRRKRSSYAA